ncbi:type IV secretion protein Rhs [Burkholderia vietnamiensis]|uniref:type VI secretion system Vgr family protein n=1 Tax=Burkholderia vietnamiensis TaxID=60552 RepID=UPI000621ED52|nr:type VI secretion system tip protein TssI/VgrG [Burkholderia vietnamiensis]KKI36258.1 type IV secretion protein Rhs [Burkholderia vietnamiensis]KVE96572.1 type IV secretion protein Rhs [Burkholderia vietnamiensis]MBR8357720.1 type VI secretion system tip protein VgrG [Burkholderia vietnamiensis]HDR8967127.1 type VI secretion system tip protein VgrG [Burkholderia vietnamiensis]HDR9190270.1 type VI secretion system tip protein VgrG [Burkholderia vietnamiensis]
MEARASSVGELSSSGLFDAFHRGILQNDRLLKLDTPLGANTLVALRAEGHAKIGRDYRWTIDVASMRTDLALLSLMHQPVTLWIQQETAPFAESTYLPVHGFVHRIGMLGADGGLAVYQLEISSALHFLGHTRDDHFWLEKDAREILANVFDRYPQLQGLYRFDTVGTPRVRSYCRQAESDLNFVHRLLEDEGWYFYWEHATTQSGEPPKTTLVIVDRLSSLPQPKDATYTRGNASNESNGVAQWAAIQTLQSVRYTTRSFDYKRPNYDFEAVSEIESTTYEIEQRRQRETQSIPTVPMEVFESTPYGYPTTDAGGSRAQLHTQAWDAQALRYAAVAGLRWIDAGRRFVLNDHPRHSNPDAKHREFVAIEARWLVENNVPIARQGAAFPHSLQRRVSDAKAVRGSDFQSPPHPADGETGFFVVDVEAQPTTIEYRSPFEHRKPIMHIEHAIVVAPEGEEAWADESNRIRVRHAWDRQSPAGAFNTSPLLLSLQSDTGNSYGSVHVPRAGEWVAISHWGGDCDRPFVLGRLNGGTTPPPWHTNVLLSGFQSSGFGGTGAFNSFVHDDSTNQGATRLTSFTGSSYSSFHQGYLISHDRNKRGRYLGAGFRIHTDDYGAVRANRGLYLSTHAKAHDAEQLDVVEARDQLTRSGMLVESLSSASATAQAESLEGSQDTLKAVAKATEHPVSGQTSGGRTDGGGTGEANGFAAPIIMMATPADIGLTSRQSTSIAADRHINLTSGEHTHLATGKSLIVAAAEKISLFVQKAGMKLFAAKGKVEIAAQSDSLSLFADRDVTVTSNQGRVVIEAKQELILKCGGSYIRITAEGIEDGSRGPRTIKSASFSRQGPSSIAEHMNSLPKTAFNDPYVLRHSITGEVLKNHPYEFVRSDGTVIKGVTDELGKTSVQKNVDVETMIVRVLPRTLNDVG